MRGTGRRRALATLGTGLLAAWLPGIARAGAQREEDLSASVRASLARAVSDRSNVDWADLDTRAWVRGMLRTAALADNNLAIIPVTAGVAMEVPSITAYPVGTVEMTPTPGPAKSISGPLLEKFAMKKLRSGEPALPMLSGVAVPAG